MKIDEVLENVVSEAIGLDYTLRTNGISKEEFDSQVEDLIIGAKKEIADIIEGMGEKTSVFMHNDAILIPLSKIQELREGTR